MEQTRNNRETIFRHPQTDMMSTSYNAAFEATPFKSLASSRQATHRSYHTLPRKRNSIPSTPTMMQQSSSLCSSASHLSMASFQTTPEDYTFTSGVNPNYTNMMNDNQLIDSCQQAQIDIRDRNYYGWASESGISSATSLLPDCDERQKNNKPQNNSTHIMSLKDTVFNAQKLQQWIAYMRRYVEAVSPNRSEVLRMTSFERKTRLGEQVDLRKYIASYDATVKRFVRSATCAKNGGIKVKHLEENYLMLLLQAIDAQCLLEGYPGMRNGRSCGPSNEHDEDDDDDDSDFDGKPSMEPIVARFVEGQCNSPAIAYNYYCLNKSPVEDKGSEYSYDSVDGTNLRDEILEVIELESTASMTKPENIQCADSLLKETLEVPNQTDQPSNWTKKNVNRWLHFQPISKTPTKPIQVIPPKNVLQPTKPIDVNPTLAVRPTKSSSNSPVGSEMSFDPDQHWDDYQEIYSTDGSSIVDMSVAEELLHFGDNYSDLLRKSIDGSTLLSDEYSSSSTSSISISSPVFHDESNAHAQLDDSFLLSGYTKSLELSALKSIDEIFDFKELHSTVGAYGAIEWIDPSRSPRRSPSGTSCSQSTMSTSSRQLDESMVATTSSYFSALDTGQADDGLFGLDSNQDTSRSMSMESLLLDDMMHDKTLMPIKTSPNTNKIPDKKPSPVVVIRKVDPTLLLPSTKRIVHKARRRKSTPPFKTPIERSNEITKLVAQNIKEMRPNDVDSLVDTCRSHLGCLNHVLLGQTVNCIVAHPAMNITRCDAAKQSDQLCRCGPIARFVQSMIDFLLDFSNSFRHFRLYQLFVRTMRQLYGMVQQVSKGVRRHRMEMNSIEFVL